MSKLYLCGVILAAVIAAWCAGAVIGRAKCMENVANRAAVNSQQQIAKKEKINAEIYRTGVRDIRDILRAKYTIAD